jgi:hypothetical protein
MKQWKCESLITSVLEDAYLLVLSSLLSNSRTKFELQIGLESRQFPTIDGLEFLLPFPIWLLDFGDVLLVWKFEVKNLFLLIPPKTGEKSLYLCLQNSIRRHLAVNTITKKQIDLKQ